MRRRWFISSVVVAALGLSAALLVYLNARDDADLDENVQIVVVDGKTYRIPLTSTKMYRRELERFGGQAAVLFDDLSRWFSGLWRGRSLAVTLVWITALVSLGLLAVSRHMPSDPDSRDRGGEP